MLRVGLDVSPLLDTALTGIPLTVESLLREFLSFANTDVSFQLVGGKPGEIASILHRRGIVPAEHSFGSIPSADFRVTERFPALGRGAAAWATRKIDGRVLKPWGQWETSRRVRAARCDVFHHTALLRVSSGAARRHIVTIYDLTPRFFPETHNRVNRVEWERLAAFAKKRADLIITDSESAKADVIHHLKITEDRVRAIPLGLRKLPPPLDAGEAARLRAACHLPEGSRFVLTVGSLEPRKNIPRLLEAFSLIADDPAALNVRLVIVGAKRHGSDAVSEAIVRYNLGNRVTVTGYLSDAHLAHLFRTCSAFVYPSLYEGFGLPVLEALALGAPTLTSNTSALPEVAGDAALLFDPHSAKQIADALLRVLTDAALANDLQARGPSRAALFGWAKCANAHLAAYREVAG